MVCHCCFHFQSSVGFFNFSYFNCSHFLYIYNNSTNKNILKYCEFVSDHDYERPYFQTVKLTSRYFKKKRRRRNLLQQMEFFMDWRSSKSYGCTTCTLPIFQAFLEHFHLLASSRVATFAMWKSGTLPSLPLLSPPLLYPFLSLPSPPLPSPPFRSRPPYCG